MRRRGTRLNLVIVAGLAVVVAAAFLIQGGTSSSDSFASPRSVAEKFAGAYVRYLDGQAPLTALPDAEPGVLKAANGTIIPRRARVGQLVLAGLSFHSQSPTSARAALAARDRRHVFPAEISLVRRGGGWEVDGLVPPDLAMLDPPVPAPPTPTPAKLAAAKFALGYLDYREGVRRAAPAGLPLIRSQIATGKDPLAKAAATHARARLVKLQAGPVTKGTAAMTATLSAGGSETSLLFTMQQVGGRWQASQFILPGGS